MPAAIGQARRPPHCGPRLPTTAWHIGVTAGDALVDESREGRRPSDATPAPADHSACEPPIT